MWTSGRQSAVLKDQPQNTADQKLSTARKYTELGKRLILNELNAAIEKLFSSSCRSNCT